MSQPRELFGGDAGSRDQDHPNNAVLTPEWVLDLVRKVFGGQIELDPATEPNNPTKAKKFFTIKDDGLKQKWGKKKVFLNPPYGKAARHFAAKAMEEADKGARVLMLLAVRPSSSWQQALLATADDILFFNKRIKFLDVNGKEMGSPAFDSMLVALNTELSSVDEAGVCVSANVVLAA